MDSNFRSIKQYLLLDSSFKKYDRLEGMGEFIKISDVKFGFFNRKGKNQIYSINSNKFQKVGENVSQAWFYDIKQWKSKYIGLSSSNQLQMLDSNFEVIK